MKLGWVCIIAGIGSLVASVVMLMNGTVFARGFVIFAILTLFGLYLIRRARRRAEYLEAARRWARENPEDARKWLNETDDSSNS